MYQPKMRQAFGAAEPSVHGAGQFRYCHDDHADDSLVYCQAVSAKLNFLCDTAALARQQVGLNGCGHSLFVSSLLARMVWRKNHDRSNFDIFPFLQVGEDVNLECFGNNELGCFKRTTSREC
jgi:hypothetical protein